MTVQKPEADSKWMHHSGRQYTVLCLSNEHSTKPEFEPSVVYLDDEGRIWSRPLAEWHEKFQPIDIVETEQDIDSVEAPPEVLERKDLAILKELSNAPLLYALDYDGTCTTNILFWTQFILQAKKMNIAVIIVTMRSPEEGRDIDLGIGELATAVICTNRKAKRQFCADLGLFPDVWIDDAPSAILYDADQAYALMDSKERRNFGVIQDVKGDA